MGLSKKTKLIVSLALTISLTSVLTIGCNNGVSQSNNNKTQEASNDSTLIYTQGIEQTTIYGKVKGSKENNEKTLLWQGIPYAKAPIGNLRWKAPEDPEIWNNVFDATTPGNVDIQLSGSDIIGSEDCLNLDIYIDQTLMKLTFLYYYLFMEVIIKLVLVLKLMQENLLLMLIV